MTCRMGKPIRTGVRVCMPRIEMYSIGMLTVGNRVRGRVGIGTGVNNLLLEDGRNLLLEDGGVIMLEAKVNE